jgi:alpha-glucosidase
MAEQLEPSHQPWWQRAVIYQIYSRSFQDANGDGVGDLHGIAARLPYLAWLGIDAVWISPIYSSPMADFGYDISDHTAIEPMFGDLRAFRDLVRRAHRLGIRVLLDYVPNHTSIEHPWFAASRASRTDPRRDWYIWRDGTPEGGPPNNWRAVFGGSAWTLDERTGQYYYHAYLKEQPDLNWRNPGVREAMLGVLRFWLELGVDGFRVDALRQLLKDPEFRDNPPNPDYREAMPPYDALLPVHTTDLDEIHAPIAQMRAVIASHGEVREERLMVAELYLPIERLVRYYGENGAGVQIPSNIHLIATPWQPRPIAQLIENYESALPPSAWPNWVLGNHDRSRIASRVGAAQARVAAMLLLTLRGTPTLYYGDELGMRDVPIAPEQVRDPYELQVPGIGVGRDPERTPMQWEPSAGAGFCAPAVTPWLPLTSDHRTVNVAAEREDPHSMLNLYRQLLALRRSHDAPSGGAYETVTVSDEVLCYRRRSAGQAVLIALNFSAEEQTIPASGRVLLCTELDRAGGPVNGTLTLRANEGVILSGMP